MINHIKIYVLMVFGFIMGCTSQITEQFVDPELYPYAQNFLIEVEKTNINLDNETIKFLSLSGGSIGACNYLFKEIYIDPKYWYNYSNIEKKALIYHEAGHCFCYESHDDSLYDDGCAKSLMHSTQTDKYCLDTYWNEYMKDMKEKCR